MDKRKKRIPKELENDAIVEALLEIRFDMKTIPEVFFGRLADFKPWKSFKQRRMPAYEIPPPVRQADANLRYQPVFELLSETETRSVRVGAHVVSYHRFPPYAGWDKFKPELVEAIEALFSRSEGMLVRRLGLRYINAIRTDLHGLHSVADLDMGVSVDGEDISSNVNLNFSRELSEETECTVRVATSQFVQGNLPENTSIIIDVDIYTNKHFKTTDQNAVIEWIETAHDREKEQFFSLLKEDTIEELRKK